MKSKEQSVQNERRSYDDYCTVGCGFVWLGLRIESSGKLAVPLRRKTTGIAGGLIFILFRTARTVLKPRRWCRHPRMRRAG